MQAMTDELRRELFKHFPDEQFWELLGIVKDAVNMNPLDWPKSIFGPFRSWLPPHDGYSEFTIINLWRLKRTLKFLINTGIPSLPTNPPPFGPPLLNELFWHPSLILQRPDHNGSYTSFTDESWFFVNGIMTNDSVAQLNAAYLAYLFHRPITLVQNSSSSFFIDLLQCAIGKEWNRMTEPALKAFPPIYAALKNPSKERVIVVAHSQGTIIMSNVVRWLNYLVSRWLFDNKKISKPPKPPLLPEINRANVVAVAPAQFYVPEGPTFVYPDDEPWKLEAIEPLQPNELLKLEVYCFANCASEMEYCELGEWQGKTEVPWIENFGNEMDLVARLGMLAPQPDKWHIAIDGPCYMHPQAWGHLLNAHYLWDIQKYQKRGWQPVISDNPSPYELLNVDEFPDAQVPRLFNYINGGKPPLRQVPPYWKTSVSPQA